jgi:hypothetical protein
MTLYLETSEGFKEWKGEPIDGKRHPLNIESVWKPDELAAIGLYAPVDPGVPPGKVVVGERIARERGQVVKVYQFEDAPPEIRPPTIEQELSDIKARLDALEAAKAEAVKA